MFPDTVDAALLALRAAVGPRRAEVRRSDERGIVTNAGVDSHKIDLTP